MEPCEWSWWRNLEGLPQSRLLRFGGSLINSDWVKGLPLGRRILKRHFRDVVSVQIKILHLLMVSLFFFPSCALPPPRPSLTIETIGVLPFDNESNDLNAPDILQRYVYLALKSSPYKVLDIDFINEKLAKVGILDGGQLAIVDPKKLGKDLGVQALMFGYVSSFDYVNLGYYRHKKVSLELTLIDVTTGDTLWEGAGTGFKMDVAADQKEAEKEFLKGLADQFAEKMLKTPLDDEARMSVTKALKTLPGFRFTGFAADGNTKPVIDTTREILQHQIEKK